MTTSPCPHSAAASRPGPVPGEGSPLYQPSLGTLALSWPELPTPCTNPVHSSTDTPRAVLCGTVFGVAAAYCLNCAAAYGFEAADGRTVPSPEMLYQARATARHRAGEVSTFGEDATGWPRPMTRRPVRLDTPNDHDPDQEPEEVGVGEPADTAPAGQSSRRLARRLPVPWINGKFGLDGDFYSFRDDALRSVEDRLCAVCGDQMVGDVALGAMNGTKVTSGGWCHPRCMSVAVALCPHFTTSSVDVVAWRYRGPGVGIAGTELGEDNIDDSATPLTRAELTAWARSDPWGLEGAGLQGIEPPGAEAHGTARQDVCRTTSSPAQ